MEEDEEDREQVIGNFYVAAESRNLIFRVDAINLFNHPTPGTPSLNINSGTFGQITSKTGSRAMAIQMRLEF